MLRALLIFMAASLTIGAARPDPTTAVQRLRTIDTQRVWPAFRIRDIPVMIFDGSDTWLFDHPSPPDGFQHRSDRVWLADGRHPDHRANTAVHLNGIWTAAFTLGDTVTQSDEALLRLMVHECFHVHQHRVLPEHALADEAAAFTYPADDEEEITLRRVELLALRRALETNDPRWAGRFVLSRRARHERLSPAHAAYERAIERKEGLAEYVAWMSISPDEQPPIPEAFAPSDLRRRAYTTGLAMAMLLDRLMPQWKQRMVEDPSAWLDVLLDEALESVDPAAIAEDDARAINDRARADALAVRARRQEMRSEFLSRPGWAIEIIAPDESPFFPNAFDPLNVRPLSETEVLHTRWLRLASASSSIEILDTPVLTWGRGPHPLFNGVTRCLIRGLPDEPAVTLDTEAVTITSEGVHASLGRATIEREGRLIRIRLAAKATPSDKP